MAQELDSHLTVVYAANDELPLTAVVVVPFYPSYNTPRIKPLCCGPLRLPFPPTEMRFPMSSLPTISQFGCCSLVCLCLGCGTHQDGTPATNLNDADNPVQLTANKPVIETENLRQNRVVNSKSIEDFRLARHESSNANETSFFSEGPLFDNRTKESSLVLPTLLNDDPNSAGFNEPSLIQSTGYNDSLLGN